MKLLSRLLLVSVLMAQGSVTCFAASRGKAPADPQVKKAVTLLVKEAKVSWRKDHKWPREQSNFLQQKELTLTPKQITQSLGQPLHSNAAMDAYIKWQLLGGVKDFKKVDPKVVRQIIAKLPKLAAQPNITRGLKPALVTSGRGIGFDPIISVLNDGVTLDSKGIVSSDGRTVMMNMQVASSKLIEMRSFTKTANAPNINFRADLTNRLEDGTEKLGLLFQDASDRLYAADPTYKKAIEQFVVEAEKLSRSRKVSMRTRRAMLEQLDKLGKVKLSVIRRIDIKSKHSYDHVKEDIAFPKKQLQRATLALQGKTPKKK